MGLFDFLKGSNEPKGEIAYYGLSEWFLGLTIVEKDKLREYYSMGMGRDPKYLDSGNDSGNISSSSQTKQNFLYGLGDNAQRSKDYVFAEKILLKALEADDNNVIDRHFTYNSLIDLYYKQRDTSPVAIENCMKYCIKDINILEEFLQAFKMEYNDSTPPRIPSIHRLIIIYEKLGNFKEGIKLCELAIKLGLSDGTKNGFEGRRTKLEKKQSKKSNGDF